MRINYEGCAICDSTWGDLWAEVEGERRFFCCAICLVQFQELIARIRAGTGWARIDALEIAGDRVGRSGSAVSGPERFGFRVAFNAQGHIRWFEGVTSGSSSPAA